MCILCYERDHAHCHRQWIAEIIEDRDGVKVENLVGAAGVNAVIPDARSASANPESMSQLIARLDRFAFAPIGAPPE